MRSPPAASSSASRRAANSREPVCLVHVATAGTPAVHQSRVVVDVGAGARCTLLEHFVVLGEAAVLGNLAAELVARRGRRDQPPAPAPAWRRPRPRSRPGSCAGRRGSRYEQHLLALGGRLLRSNLDLALEGAHAACRLDGLFLADGERQVDLLTQVTHRGAATETVQDYRGIATARGRGAFNGRIVVEASARGSNASQSSRNLLLSPLAEINARPQLEINVDDVQCRHGATIGTLDDGAALLPPVARPRRGRRPRLADFRVLPATWSAACRSRPCATPREALVAGALPDRELIRGAG